MQRAKAGKAALPVRFFNHLINRPMLPRSGGGFKLCDLHRETDTDEPPKDQAVIADGHPGVRAVVIYV